ncbi:hypothetical protein AX14_008678 [Amanita brunnescens Koide BX004]|nr:hypothetical protein AX14_009200 [Amanita brunnescens Koide BX004]KAF8724694.1 hypothetical protein AX14_008678 [Amanita brunnescens Koide BX004]
MIDRLFIGSYKICANNFPVMQSRRASSSLSVFADLSSAAELRVHRKSQPFQHAAESSNLATDGSPKVVIGHNWASSAWNKTKVWTFTSVTGTFTAPQPRNPEGYASVSVGIDGYTCPTVILQAGIDVDYINGTTSFLAWYEWYPAGAVSFDNFTINAGDEIQVTVIATSNTTGIAKVVNLSDYQIAKIGLNSTVPLCRKSVEWIVEDFERNNKPVPFTDFGAVKFKEARAEMTDDDYSHPVIITPDGADLIIFQQNNRNFTSVTEDEFGSTITHIPQ